MTGQTPRHTATPRRWSLHVTAKIVTVDTEYLAKYFVVKLPSFHFRVICLFFFFFFSSSSSFELFFSSFTFIVP